MAHVIFVHFPTQGIQHMGIIMPWRHRAKVWTNSQWSISTAALRYLSCDVFLSGTLTKSVESCGGLLFSWTEDQPMTNIYKHR